MNTVSNEMVQTWLASKEIIKTMLHELRPDLNEESHDHNAAAIIARLATANLLIRKVETEEGQ